MRLLAAIFLLLLTAVAVLAQSAVPVTTSSATVTTTAGGQQLVPYNAARRALRICNVGATNTMWICPGTQTSGITPLGITPAANAAGCVPLGPVASNVAACWTEPPVALPPPGAQALSNAAWNAIAITGTTTATVMEY